MGGERQTEQYRSAATRACSGQQLSSRAWIVLFSGSTGWDSVRRSDAASSEHRAAHDTERTATRLRAGRARGGLARRLAAGTLRLVAALGECAAGLRGLLAFQRLAANSPPCSSLHHACAVLSQIWDSVWVALGCEVCYATLCPATDHLCGYYTVLGNVCRARPVSGVRVRGAHPAR